MRRTLAFTVIALLALTGCAAQSEAAAPPTTVAPAPTSAAPASAEPARVGYTLAESLDKWDEAVASNDGTIMYAMALNVPRLVEADCVPTLGASEGEWIVGHGEQALADLEAAKGADGSLQHSAIFVEMSSYMKLVRETCL